MLPDPVTGNPSIPFTLYAMECEGDIDTQEGKKNKLRKRLRERAETGVIDVSDVLHEAAELGLDLTFREALSMSYDAYK